MTSVIKHSLRATAASFGGYRPEGWSPKLQVALRGPVPAAAELVWSVLRPGGSAWFEHRAAVPPLGSDACATLQLQHVVDGVDIPDTGTVRFTLRLVSELEGVDEPLHDGAFAVEAISREHRFAVDNEWMHGLALLALDAHDEPDAPPLVAAVFVTADADPYQYEAHLFRGGTRLAQASRVDSGHTFTANDGAAVGYELAVTFEGVRGWNNLSDSGWGGDWHLLDANDGAYEVKVLCASRVVRVVPFEVIAGRIVAPGAVELDPAMGAVVMVESTPGAGAGPGSEGGGGVDAGGVEGRAGDGGTAAAPTPAFYGDAVTAAVWGSIDDVYAQRIEPPTTEARAFDDDTGRALQAFFDRVERIVNTWEADMIGTPGPFDHGQVLGAEAVLAERPGYLELADRAAAVPDDYGLELNEQPTTAAQLRARVPAIFAAAEARLADAAQADCDAVSPFRALLTGDRLAVFDEHPAPDFVYTSIGRRVIETPEQVAEAEYWFFEGPVDLPGSATVDGVDVEVSLRGWRVVGWRFAPDDSIIDHFESMGQGSSAPLSAFEGR